ncbi:hypothetical protein CEXT_656971 [Caerostris extrusa]|uniref:Uncharacterized protein n=1 Tax=Caerostris extrusa TaxID=172846 RepID=A0AAV4TAE1_CAEEX|nr:hypothetical protein CEXT_656971 [Caerostris extrusa]
MPKGLSASLNAPLKRVMLTPMWSLIVVQHFHGEGEERAVAACRASERMIPLAWSVTSPDDVVEVKSFCYMIEAASGLAFSLAQSLRHLL